MFQELKFQLSTAFLTIVTLAVSIAAIINFDQQQRFRLPDDGVVWVDRAAGVEALYVTPRSGGAKAGLHPGDCLKSIDGVPIKKTIQVAQVLATIGSWRQAKYTLTRGGVEFEPTFVVEEAPRDRAVIYQYLVGLAYLAIGLFVYFRRGSAHKARHFYVLCLASFIVYCFHYTGKLNGFDKLVYYGNVAWRPVRPHGFPAFLPDVPGAAEVVPRAGARGSPVRARGAALPAVPRFFLRRPENRDFAGGSELAAGPRGDGVFHRALPGRQRWRWLANTAKPKTPSSASSSNGCATARCAARCRSPCSTCCRTPPARFPAST